MVSMSLYFKEDHDLYRCGIFHTFLIMLLHRISSMIKQRPLACFPSFIEVIIVILAHKFFRVFHMLSHLRTFFRRI